MLHVKIIFSKLRLVSLLCKGYGVTYWKFQKVRESCLRLISPEQQGFRYGLRLHSLGAWPGFCLDSYRSSCYIMLLLSHRVCYVKMYFVVLLWNNNRFLGSSMLSLRYKHMFINLFWYKTFFHFCPLFSVWHYVFYILVLCYVTLSVLCSPCMYIKPSQEKK